MIPFPPTIAAWLASKTAGIAGRALMWLLIILIGFAPFYLSYRAGFNASEAKHVKAEAKAQIADLQWLVNERETNARLAGDYVLRRAATTVRYEKLLRRIHDVTTVYRDAPDAAPQPLPRCVFTVGFARLWDRASAGAAFEPDATGGVSGTASTAAATSPAAASDAISSQ